jgi:hypothetical protein
VSVLQEPGSGSVLAPSSRDLAAPSPGARAARLSWVLRPLVLYAASRLLVLVAAGTGALLAPDDGAPLNAGPWPAGGSTGIGAVDALLRWDSAWYLHIADAGYGTGSPDGRNAFFPLLPGLVRLLESLPGVGLLEAGLALGHIAGAAATVAVWVLGRRLSGAPAADRMAALFAFFPGSGVFSMVYAEGLVIALAAGVLLALDSRRWLLAGLLAALATSARPNGVAVAAACAWAALAAVARPGEGRREWRALLAPALAPVGLLAFFGFLAARTGDPTAWFTAQREVWGERVDPTAQVERIARVLADPLAPLGGPNTWLPVLGLVVLAVTFVTLLVWRPPGPVVAYTVATCALVLVSASIGARPRMVLTAFPLVMGLAYVARGVGLPALVGLAAGSTALLTVLNVATLTGTP